MIYFIRDGKYIKIGISVDPLKRLASFQTSHHNELELMAVMPGGADLEAGLHRSFSQFSKRGEWFEESPQLLAFIENVKATYPDVQRQFSQATRSVPGNRVFVKSECSNNAPLGQGETFTFRMTAKGLFRNPCTAPHEMWYRVAAFNGGYWKGWQDSTWNVLHAPGLRFDFIDMHHVAVTRIGELQLGPRPFHELGSNYSTETVLKDTLKNAVYNRKNNSTWLGVYNDDTYGIMVAVRKAPKDDHVRLDVPEEVMDYWRAYKYPSPLPNGVSIEA